MIIVNFSMALKELQHIRSGARRVFLGVAGEAEDDHPMRVQTLGLCSFDFGNFEF